jgi:hypothetical protein
MNPPSVSFNLTKAEASLRHIEQAIAAFELGLFDVTITLAGAAEGMAPETAAPHLLKTLREHPRIMAEGTLPKEWNATLNLGTNPSCKHDFRALGSGHHARQSDHQSPSCIRISKRSR